MRLPVDSLVSLPKHQAGECWEEVCEGTSCTRVRAPGRRVAQGFRARTWRAGSSSSTPKVPSLPWDPPLQASYPLLPVALSSAPARELVLSMAAPGQGHPVPGAPPFPAHGGGNSRYPRERPLESLAVWGQSLPLSKSPFFRGFGQKGPSQPHGGLSQGLRGRWQLLEGPHPPWGHHLLG